MLGNFDTWRQIAGNSILVSRRPLKSIFLARGRALERISNNRDKGCRHHFLHHERRNAVSAITVLSPDFLLDQADLRVESAGRNISSSLDKPIFTFVIPSRRFSLAKFPLLRSE